MYAPYIEYEEYINMGGKALPPSVAEELLTKASRHIDILTYGRIHKFKFENLTDFQKEVIKETTKRLADFEYENEDVLETVLSSYSINGVAMSFGETWNVKTINGVAIKTEDFQLLEQSGLTTGSLRF